MKYSLVLFPSTEQLVLIKSYKKLLESNIEKFASRNSDAHVTISEFKNEKEINIYLNRLKTFCNLTIPERVVFDKFIFGSQTFFIAPNNTSKTYLNQLIRNLHNHIGKKNHGISAHISIGRELTAEQMQIASSLFANLTINFEFICDTLYLRRFNEQTKQYSDIVETFQLKGKSQPDLFTI